MDIDPPQGQSLKQKSKDLQSLTTGPLSSSVSRLSSSSRAIPSDKDFHFFYNFNEFKLPIKEIVSKSQSLLETIGSSSHIWGKPAALPEDIDDAYDWLVNINDEVFERFDVSVDEFQKVRKKEEETGRAANSVADSEDGFQLVYGRKKRGMSHSASRLAAAEKDEGDSSSPLGVKVAARDKKTMGAKPRVPFHIPTIPRPQDVYKIIVNNVNQPFEHVWLQKSEDEMRFVHPLEKLSVLDFVDRNIGDLEPVKPPPIEASPFKFVEEVKDLKELAAKLRNVDEFAVDLEHNQYRSFQGLTCLMQISTRTEDFVVDTLKLRIHIGPYLREVFKDPTKKKVMHGADRDIVWLQRDFGIYICNLFDTGQASRLLKLERNSLEYLLHHFCGVTANKEYQNADWRLRPLPDEMMRYAREDTHYLLHIYDLLRIRLLTTSNESETSDALLVEVYKRSYDVCMQLYEKELLTDSSYLHIYGMQDVDFNAQQLAIVAGLCEWRDVVARAEDESTGYILSNKTLLEIAKQMPVTVSKLRFLLKSKHSYIENCIGSVVSIIKHSLQNAAAFEAVAEQLKVARLEIMSQEPVVADGIELSPPLAPPTSMNVDATAEIISSENTENGNIAKHVTGSMCVKEEPMAIGNTTTELQEDRQEGSTEHLGENSRVKKEADADANADTSVSQAATVVPEATIQVLTKPSRGFGALLANSASKRKFDMVKKDKEAIKLEQIKSSVNLPFHSFAGKDEQRKLVVEEHPEASRGEHPENSPTVPASGGNVDEIILLEGDSIVEESNDADSESPNEQLEYREDNSARVASKINDEDEPMSLSELSSSFQKCFQSKDKPSKDRQAEKTQESVGFPQLKPFDYEAARKQVIFGGNPEKQAGADGNENRRNSSRGKKNNNNSKDRPKKDDETGDFQQGKRRQAFPATGNRSSTFRGV